MPFSAKGHEKKALTAKPVNFWPKAVQEVGVQRFTAEPSSRSHSHDLVAAVDVEDLAGDGGRAVAGQKRSRRAKFFRQHVALQRRMRFVVLQHFGETRD